jgi:DNA-directed RNA polymerase subunit M/transcription elongation factor TFIIS
MVTIHSDIGINILNSVLKSDKNSKIFERNIRNISVSNDNYKTILYQTMVELTEGKNKKDVLSNLKKLKMGWHHSTFKILKEKLDEQDDFTENPFEVEEGVIECKCGSHRVYSYSKQCRGSDEPMTTFAQCIQCKNKWTYSG